MKVISIVAALALLASSAAAQSAKGKWEGSYKSTSSGGEITMVVDSAKSGWTVALQTRSEYSPPNPKFYDATEVRVKGDSISFTVSWGPQVVLWSGTLKGATASGNVASQYWTGTWSAKRSAPPRP